MYEASKQWERAFVPECFYISKIDSVISDYHFDKIIVFCERIAEKTIRDSFLEHPVKNGDKVLVIVGPEGGFSQKEFEYFEKQNFEMLTLGNLILKADTAVVVSSPIRFSFLVLPTSQSSTSLAGKLDTIYHWLLLTIRNSGSPSSTLLTLEI